MYILSIVLKNEIINGTRLSTTITIPRDCTIAFSWNCTEGKEDECSKTMLVLVSEYSFEVSVEKVIEYMSNRDNDISINKVQSCVFDIGSYLEIISELFCPYIMSGCSSDILFINGVKKIKMSKVSTNTVIFNGLSLVNKLKNYALVDDKQLKHSQAVEVVESLLNSGYTMHRKY